LHSAFDVAVIGAGIVGLSTAKELTARYPNFRVLVLEKESQLAVHQTGHNSGVIHSGVYYRPGSLKAKFCVEGAAEMVRFCETHAVPHEICGKLIIAAEEWQRPALDELYRRALANGVPGVRPLPGGEICDYEPHAAGFAALLVPGTGITNYRLVAEKYAEMANSAGAQIQTSSAVVAIGDVHSEFTIETTSGVYSSKFLINCAGLHSDRIARLAGAKLPLQIIPFRGEYYELRPERRGLVRTLIYPVPDPRFPFLGVHFTKKIGDGVEAGPNAVLALKREGYTKTAFHPGDVVDQVRFPGFWRMAKKYWKTGFGEMYRSFNKAAFVTALQKLVPEIREEDLINGSAGVRAQAVDKNGALVDDFQFVSQARALHVCNVPSPAATASLPIGRHIVEVAARDFGWSQNGRPASVPQ
jgi:L-2-hydroxyglutarate oxidase LhgO